MPLLTSDLLPNFLQVAALLLAWLGARRWMALTADLDLGLFRPWRGDPWPIGVQEDDDFRFNWTAPSTARARVAPASTADDGLGAIGGSVIEDLEKAPTASHRIDRIRVRRVGH